MKLTCKTKIQVEILQNPRNDLQNIYTLQSVMQQTHAI